MATKKAKRPRDVKGMRDFRKIKAWMLADDLAVAVYEVSKVIQPRETRQC